MSKLNETKVLRFPSSEEASVGKEASQRMVIEVHHYHHSSFRQAQARRKRGLKEWWENLPLIQKLAVAWMVLSVLACLGGYTAGP